MPYAIGFAAKDQPKAPTGQRATATAAEARRLVQVLEANGSTIRWITRPDGTEIDRRELDRRAEDERSAM